MAIPGRRGFIEIAPGLFGNPVPLYTHSLGALSTNPSDQNLNDAVGGPWSSTPQHACDGKGIDYFEACYPCHSRPDTGAPDPSIGYGLRR